MEIDLADAVQALRGEVERAVAAGHDQQVKFEAIDIKMEFQVGITRSAEAKGGVKFWVLDLSGTGKYAREAIQRVSVTLRPTLADGTTVHIARGEADDPLAGS